jgi:tetraacyldisaccharide 4'-kinase
MRPARQAPAWQGWLTHGWTHRGLLAWLLWPISGLFGALAALRCTLYRTGTLKAARVAVPVIVVGNVVVGGSGKTPVVIALVRHLQSWGLQVGVISRGYGRQARDCREVLADSAIADVGDEPALIRRTTDAVVFVAARRFEAASALLARYPAIQVIICDDGLQHLSLLRDLEICVFDDRGIGNGLLLPAGPLREPWPKTVDLVLHTGDQPAFAGFTATRRLAHYAVTKDGHQVPLAQLTGPGTKPLLALAAIAKPAAFFSMLQAQGLTLTRTIVQPDHDSFADWQRHDYRNYTILCTEKDAVKLWHRDPDALAVPLLLTPEPAFLAAVEAKLATLLAKPPAPTLSSPHGHKTS